MRRLRADLPNHVWCADIGHAGSRVLGRCADQTTHKLGPPEIMNADQGSQLTSLVLTDRLRRPGVRMSMDGKGRFLDNILVERLWRSSKTGRAYLRAGETGSEVKAGVINWIEFYNLRRLHSALGGKTHAVVYWQRNETTNSGQQLQRVA